MSDIFTLKIDNNQRKILLQAIEREVKFLQENNLMDYSILVGIEHIPQQKLNIQSSFIKS